VCRDLPVLTQELAARAAAIQEAAGRAEPPIEEPDQGVPSRGPWERGGAAGEVEVEPWNRGVVGADPSVGAQARPSTPPDHVAAPSDASPSDGQVSDRPTPGPDDRPPWEV
jgi:hypothetical protein